MRSVTLAPEDVLGFYEAWKQDCLDETFQQNTSMAGDIITVVLQKRFAADDPNYSKYGNSYYTDEFTIKPYQTNVINWLKEKGYYDTVAVTADDIAYGEVYKHNDNSSAEMERVASVTADTTMQYVDDTMFSEKFGPNEQKIGRITDKAQIAEILETGQLYSVRYDEYYYVVLYPANSSIEEASFSRYYDMDRVPSFVKNPASPT